MDILKKLQARIKGSRLYFSEENGICRLYIPYIHNQRRGIKSSVWFEVVNDRLQPFVRVENVFARELRDGALEQKYLTEIYAQFHELIYDCELERKKLPLHERLADAVIAVHEESLKHQANALRFCCSMKVSALFADTGTGKSKVAIDLCMSRHLAGQVRKFLIVCPVSVKSSFKNEIEKWGMVGDFEWKIVGHETVGSSDNTFLKLLKWVDSETQMVIDESHLIKNPIAKRSKRLKMLADKTSYKLVMTGTPMSENVHNLYMQYAVLSELIINVPNWIKFEEKYCILGGYTGIEIIGYKNLDHLMGLIEPYTWQIDKADALDLPSLEGLEAYCDFNHSQWHCYQLEKEALLERIKSDNVSATDIFRTFTKMQQIASGWYLGESIGTQKMGLFERVDLSVATVVFCKYLFEVWQVVDFLGCEKCAIFTGNNLKERDDELAKFERGERLYFVATMQSGGTGLNGLQYGCSQMVFYSNSFSYMQRKQCIGRIDRKGQENMMRVVDFRTRSGIDDRIAQVLNRKQSMADQIKRLLNDKVQLKQYIHEM